MKNNTKLSTVAVRDNGPVTNVPYIGRQGGVQFINDSYAINWLIDMMDTGNYRLSKSCKWDTNYLNEYRRYLANLGKDIDV